MTDKVINFRVDEDLKKGFEIVAKNKAFEKVKIIIRNPVKQASGYDNIRY